MNNQNAGRQGESRVSIINIVKTPLGFFVLGVVVVESILGLIVGLSVGEDRTLALKGMLAIFAGLILVVAFITFYRPANLVLHQQASSGAEPVSSLFPKKEANITGVYLAEGNNNYKITMTRLTEDYYKLSNEDWKGVGFFDGEFYYGVFKLNDGAYPTDRRGNWGLHRARRLNNGSFKLFGIELNTQKHEVGRFNDNVVGWVKKNVDNA